MITLPLLAALGVTGLAAAAGCLLGMLCAWHPGHGPDPAPPEPRTEGPRHAGYMPLANAGCYQPRTDWPEPDWPRPGDTFSEISAGWDRLERGVIAETQPFGRVVNKYLY